MLRRKLCVLPHTAKPLRANQPFTQISVNILESPRSLFEIVFSH